FEITPSDLARAELRPWTRLRNRLSKDAFRLFLQFVCRNLKKSISVRARKTRMLKTIAPASGGQRAQLHELANILHHFRSHGKLSAPRCAPLRRDRDLFLRWGRRTRQSPPVPCPRRVRPQVRRRFCASRHNAPCAHNA